MQEKVELVKAEKARTDGNVSFKKGRWVEAIGHYTTSIVANPRDAIPYSNRAAAYLKLDKYEDAERDCTTVLGLSKDHVKALYRRAMALKGLEKYDRALEDLERVLELEKNNDMALAELDEIKDLLQAQKEKLERKKLDRGDRGRLPPSPPRTTATIEEIHEVDSSPTSPALVETHRENAKKDDVGIKVRSTTASSSSSFADKKKSRLDRKTYISPGVSQTNQGSPAISTAHASSRDSTTQSSTGPAKLPSPVKQHQAVPGSAPIQLKDVTFGVNDASSTACVPTVTPKPSPSTRAPIPPSKPTSTSPAAGLSFLTQVSRLDAESTWTLLSYYPPSVIPTIVAPLLEPEQLGKILLGCKHGAESDPSRVRTILEGLRRTTRWKINHAMLDSEEKQAGQEAWQAVGGVDEW